MTEAFLTCARARQHTGECHCKFTYPANLGKGSLQVAGIDFVGEPRNMKVVSRVVSTAFTSAKNEQL
jgi:hypothetical protein